MPIGFMCLGLILLIVLMFNKVYPSKIFYIAILLFAMLGYIVQPSYYSSFSINYFFMIASIVLLIAQLKNCQQKQLFFALILSFFIGVVYVVLINIDSLYISSLSPIIIIVLALASLVFVNDIKYMLIYNACSIMFITLFGFLFETGLGYNNLLSVYFINNFVIGFTINMLILYVFQLIKPSLIKSKKVKANNLNIKGD